MNVGKNGWLYCKKDGIYTYFQVTASMVEESTFNWEIRLLKQIQDNYDGIKVIIVIDWLLENIMIK